MGKKRIVGDSVRVVYVDIKRKQVRIVEKKKERKIL